MTTEVPGASGGTGMARLGYTIVVLTCAQRLRRPFLVDPLEQVRVARRRVVHLGLRDRGRVPYIRQAADLSARHSLLAGYLDRHARRLIVIRPHRHPLWQPAHRFRVAQLNLLDSLLQPLLDLGLHLLLELLLGLL